MSNTKKTGSASVRCKNAMYTQQLKHLPLKDIDTLEQTIQKLNSIKDYALIVHDKDIENGKAVEPHVHVMMNFANAVSITKIAKDLQDQPQYVVKWNGDSNNGYSYLIHSTEHSRHKYQYDVSQVRANFDYPKKMLAIAKKVEKQYKKVAINQQLDALLRGDITKAQLEDMLTGSQYADNKRRIDAVYHKRLENMAKEHKEYMKLNNISSKVIWIYGNAGTGKTKLAKEYAGKKSKNYFVSGSSRDIFQAYEGQSTIILDELRPYSILYEDLLKLLDPFGTDKMGASRYFDKHIVADLIIITSPYNPYNFYDKMPIDAEVDSFGQLLRRLSLVIHMMPTTISKTFYVPHIKLFQDDLSTVRTNPYSAWNNQQSAQLDVNSLYDDIVG